MLGVVQPAALQISGSEAPRNQSSNLEGSGHGGFLHSSPTLSADRESIAVISRSDSGIATAGAAAQSHLPLRKLRLTLRCSDQHLVVGRSAKDTAGTLFLEGPARSIGSSTGYGAQEERWSLDLRVCHHCNPQTTHATAWSRPRLSAARTRTRSRRRQQLHPFVEVTEPGRNSEMSIHNEKMTHPRTPPQRVYCPGTWGSERDITQRQATTASRNAWVTRCLKQDPTRLYKDATSSLPDATSSLERRTRECSFREKTLLACWSAQGRWSSATQTGGSAAWCVQSTQHGKNHHRCSAVPPARESSEERAQLVEFTRSAEVRSRTMYPLGSEAKKLSMRCTCCLLILTLWSAEAGCNNHMPMCIGSFSLHSKWIGLSKRDPNSSVLRRDVESDW